MNSRNAQDFLVFSYAPRSTVPIMQAKQTIRSEAGFPRAIIIIALALGWTAASLQGQDAVYPPKKPTPPQIASQVVVVEEAVVQTQWPHTLNLVNAPENTTVLSPGQCIRIGIYSSGDGRDSYLRKSKLSFRVQFGGHSDVHPFASLGEYKQVKPEGGDFVTAALGAAGVKEPASLKTMASLGVSADRWCAPIDAHDGTASVEADVDSPSGRLTLSPTTIEVQSFETGGKKPFKNIDDFGAFLQTYYREPNSARLLPATQFLVADQTQNPRQGQAEIFAAFLTAALKADPIAAQYFQTQLASQPPMLQAIGLLALRSAGYNIDRVLEAMSTEQRQKFLTLPELQDPYDLAPTQALFQHLDMMWAVFGATGQFKPVQTIASALGWRTDYEDFDKLRHSPNPPSTLTPSIVRGVTYTAAGWSLSSFQKNDPLVADYINAMLASPDTPQSVKSGLSGLDSNPAFRQARGQ